jgi:hypothetical protein
MVLTHTSQTGVRPSSGRDGIKPVQSAKPRKITICRAQREPVFHSQCSQMSVWYEIAMYAWQREKFAEQLGVPFRRLWYPCRFACEPCMYLLPRIANRFRMFEHARIGHQPQESKQAGPR